MLTKENPTAALREQAARKHRWQLTRVARTKKGAAIGHPFQSLPRVSAAR